MKMLMTPIELMAWFTKEGLVNPLKFKYPSSNSQSSQATIKVEKIVKRHEENLAGNKTIVFYCEGLTQGNRKSFELKYEINTCKWFLYKI